MSPAAAEEVVFLLDVNNTLTNTVRGCAGFARQGIAPACGHGDDVGTSAHEPASA